jgi:NAD(P)-dependent dehydrogenase (short-subunit alcohol dehydrogenase family)
MNDKPLTAKSSIGEWIDHPVGGPLISEMLGQGGQDVSTLTPVRAFSLERLIALSNGMLTQDAVDALVRAANDGQIPEESEEAEAAPGTWTERVSSGRFDGKTVIVTGAGSGIGRATASRIAREGGRVIAVDISDERLQELATDHAGLDVVTLKADITDDAAVASIVAAAGGQIDGLANVAGIMDNMTPIHEVSDAVWHRVFAVNVDGTFKLSRAVIPVMLAAGRGSIVNVASEAALRGSAAGVAYTASKHAVVGITKSTAYMYAASGIRVNAVAPGPVLTNIGADFGSQLGQQRIGAAMTNLPPVAEASQLAASITFLLSDDGTNVTGAIVPSDGGWSVQ